MVYEASIRFKYNDKYIEFSYPDIKRHNSKHNINIKNGDKEVIDNIQELHVNNLTLTLEIYLKLIYLFWVAKLYFL